MLHAQRITTITTTAAIALCAAAPAGAQQPDLRSPDSVDRAVSAAPARTDLRAPDSVDRAVSGPKPSPDLRSPDSIDRAARPATLVSLAPARERVRIVEVPSSGFEWGDAGIGAAAMLAVTLLGLAVGLTTTQRRQRRRSPAVTQ